MENDQKRCTSRFNFRSPVFPSLQKWPTKIITKNNSRVLFADDTSLLIAGFYKLDFHININQTLCSSISWFNCNLLTLNFNKTLYAEFRTKYYFQVDTTVQYQNKDISSSTETKYLWLIIDETLSRNQHIDHITTKLCSACYALRNLK